jgi:hypothetical protein
MLDDAARNATPPRPWKKLRDDFGYLFEGYVRWWLKRLFGPSGYYLFGQSLEPNTETDAVVTVSSGQLSALGESGSSSGLARDEFLR